MAVDTAAKRLSIMDMGGPTEPGMPFPDGTIGEGDRFHLLWLYRGAQDDDDLSGTRRMRQIKSLTRSKRRR